MDTTEKQPTDFFNELPKDLQQHIDTCIKGAKSIREALSISEDHYLLISPIGTSTSRDYLLYAAMDEVEKAGMALMTSAELVSSDFPKEEDRITRNLIQQTIDGQMLWIRKLAEVLAEVILFSTTNQAEYYQHYLLVGELVRVRAAIKNSEKTYGSIVENYRQQEARFISQIEQLEGSKVDVNKCWYLKKNSNGAGVSGVKGQLSTYAERFDNAFTMATEQQIIALGLSYHEGYGHYSNSIHFSVGNPQGRRDLSGSVKRNLAGVGIVAANIVIQARTLLGNKPEKGYAAFLAQAFDANILQNPRLNNHRVKPGIKVDDYVMANGDLAQVAEIYEGKYGFRSFKVKYLLKSDTTLAGQGEKTTVWTHQNPEFEYFPAMMVGKLFDYEEQLSKTKDLILKEDGSAVVDDERLGALITKSVVDVWNAGLREEMHSRIWRKPKEGADTQNEETNPSPANEEPSKLPQS